MSVTGVSPEVMALDRRPVQLLSLTEANVRAGPTGLPTTVLHAPCVKAESELTYRHD